MASAKKTSFEDDLEKLEQLTGQLEDGDLPLEDAIAVFEQGMALKKRCEERLNAAQLRIEAIQKQANGSLDLTPLSDLEELPEQDD